MFCIESPMSFLYGLAGGLRPRSPNLLRSALKNSVLKSVFFFPGFERDIAPYFAAASVFALTSREDPFPNVVLQSIDVGIPVVAFEGATGAADFILEHQGRLATAFDPVDFAEQILDLLFQTNTY